MVAAARTHGAVAVAGSRPRSVSVWPATAAASGGPGFPRWPCSRPPAAAPPSTQEGFDRVQVACMTTARTFELEESAAADRWQIGGRRQLDQ